MQRTQKVGIKSLINSHHSLPHRTDSPLALVSPGFLHNPIKTGRLLLSQRAACERPDQGSATVNGLMAEKGWSKAQKAEGNTEVMPQGQMERKAKCSFPGMFKEKNKKMFYPGKDQLQ